jgi:ABC-type lipoprotein release transport system permease subunit
MSAVWYRFRAELRTRWRSMAALALLVGIAGGATIAAVAGARRTDTAYSRLVKATDAWDVLVNPDSGTDSALRSRDVERLPMVKSAGRLNGIGVVPADLRTPSDLGRLGIVLVSDGKAGTALGRPKILEGRAPDPRRAYEVLISPTTARQEGLTVGSLLRVAILIDTDSGVLTDASSFADIAGAVASGAGGRRVTLHVTGIGVVPDDIVVDEQFVSPQMFLTPAFAKENPDTQVPYWAEVVRLRHGAADVAAFPRSVQALVPDEAIAFQTASVTAAKVDRAVQPSVGALTVFAIVIALTGLLVIGQALARQSFLDSTDFVSLHALGLSRRQLFAGSMLRAAIVAAAGTVIGIVLAVAVSPLFPIGAVRIAEPDPGIRIDPLVLGAGALAGFLVVLALAALPAWRYARTRVSQTRDEEATRPSRLVNTAGSLGTSLSMSAGIRMALEPGRGRTAVPVRTTIMSAILAVTTVIGALVFAASLDHLVSTPRLYGWNWDIRLEAGADTQERADIAFTQLTELLESSRAVQAWGEITLSDVAVNGLSIPAVGIDPSHGVHPSVVSGRPPARLDEIALGARTMRTLGVGVGDTVRVRAPEGGSEKLRIVGRVVLPGFGTYSGADKTTLGEGAALTSAALDRFGPAFGGRSFLVDFKAGANRRPVLTRAGDIIAAANSELTGFEVGTVQRPSDIVAYSRVRTTPPLLAGVLALLAIATVAHALVTAVRRRRRDLALLKTLGFTRGQVSGSVAWQASTIGAIALVVGLPLGVVLGRWAWSALANNLGTVSEPVVPIAVLLVAVPVVLLLLNLVAYLPGRIAARTRPATVLRSE